MHKLHDKSKTSNSLQIKKSPNLSFGDFLSYGTPGEIRTPDPLVRSQVLYPTELRVQVQLRYSEYLSLWRLLYSDYFVCQALFLNYFPKN